MRWLFFFLLFANGLFAFWGQLNDDSENVPAALASSRRSAPAIPLLAEVMPEQKTQMPAEPGPGASSSSGSTDARHPAPASALKSSPDTNVSAAPTETANPVSEAAEKPLQPAVADLSTKPVPATIARVHPPEASESPPARQCMRVGPILKPEELTELATRLRQAGAQVDAESRVVQADAGFIVYLAPLASRSLALAKMRELKAAKVDSFVIAEGELANGLSLGLFSNEDNARRQMALLRSHGLPALVAPRQRQENRSYLRVQLDGGEAAGVIPETLTREKIPCD